jgi:hypothetical protein
MYGNKGYDKKMYQKMVMNKLKVMAGPTPIYTPLGLAQGNFHRGFHECID